MHKKDSSIPEELMIFLIKAQKSELTESIIYARLSLLSKNEKNKKVLKAISLEEKKHHDIWKKYTNVIVKPNKFRVKFFILITKLLGLSFGVKLMERGEVNAQKMYNKFYDYIPEAIDISHDEEKHEQKLIDMLQDRALFYMGSVVLGLNDALVELTGVLAGLTLGLQNPKLIAVVGLITGISASLSMGGSEYLSSKAEGDYKNAFTRSIYTWTAYFITVIFLILPFLFIDNPFLALPITVAIAIIIIALFNRYASIANDYNFRKRFLEMVGISLGVAIISFGIGLLVRIIFGLEI